MNLKPKFSPGIWSISKANSNTILRGEESICFAGYIPGSDKIGKENAKLIVEAPAMYDFIKCRYEALSHKEKLSTQEACEIIACAQILERINK